ncbi:geranylgeranyl reductase [Methanocaldococcus vulcanius M7]|uniref:Digeranylgeranylglycerophospholipid reductase n=1 Tax=Methanocaldococcus vulcanius (strain ATCC 700851 / DSM 12094 / M7) TaxID=579137 RepID=C9RFH7_METVM|nr:NAD(P)/FAD-dependent oxidoreductase [Methanocaldococcus vulcanius]ACX72329.1 geranylgeranyl reductase [Methanocaldococcus vulcanius M7]
MRELKDSYDVVVVGAGPGGSMASYATAKNGVKTLLIEKSQEIGEPVRCAEAIPSIEEFGIKPSPEFVRNIIKGGILFSPSGKKVVVTQGKAQGFVVERKIFDKYLAVRAGRAGAKIAVKSTVVGLERDGDYWNVIVEFLGEEYVIKTKIVIAADGVESNVAEYAGLKAKKKPLDICSCAEYEMTNVELFDKNMMEFYFGNDVAKGGYAWIFPKGETANVGLGVRDKKKKAIDYLEEFIENSLASDKLKNATPVEFKVGGAPVSGPIEKTYADGILVVGDAAGQISPLTGGGIYLAMDCGLMAGEVASKSIKSNNWSEDVLKEYERLWKEKHYEYLLNHLKYRKILEKLSDDELDALAEALGDNLDGIDLKKFVKRIITKKPSLLKYFKDLI